MRRAAIVVLGVLVLLPVVVWLGAGAALNSDAARTRIVDAVQRASGHAARIDGPIGLAWSLTPALSAEGVVLLNAPGYSRAEFVTARRIEARLALGPLVSGRVEIPSLVVVGPDALLERDAAGRGNWLAPVAPPAPPTAPSAPRSRTPVVVERVTVREGRFAYAGAPSVEVPELSVSPAGGAVSGQVVVNGVALAVSGATQAPGVGTGGAAGGSPGGVAVPFDLKAVGGGLTAIASGSFGAGSVQFQLVAPDLAAVSALAGQALPPLKSVWAGGEAGPEGLRGLRLTAGDSDLGSILPGLRVIKLEANQLAFARPAQILVQLAMRSLPIAVAASVGPAGVVGVPVQAELTADGAKLSMQGAIVRGLPAGVVSGTVPDLARSGALAGLALPGLRDMSLEGRMQVAPGGQGVLVRGLRVTSEQGDVAGDLALGVGVRPSIRGSLISQRLDLDGWGGAAAGPGEPDAPTAGPADPLPQTAPTGQPVPGAVVATPGAQPGPGPIIPDRALPFGALLRGDLDLRWSIGNLAWRGVAYRSAALRVVLQDGRLRVDPATIIAPGGPIAMVVQADASAAPPTAAIVAHGAGMDAAGLSSAFAVPGAATGGVDLDVDLRGSGATAHALVGSLSGHVGVALVDGEIENAALVGLFGPALRGANLPIDAGGRSSLRCLAARIDLAAGQAAVRALAVDASKLRLSGDGALDLGAETMDLHLRPVLRLGPTSVAVPVHLTGPWRQPRAAVEKGVIAPGRFGISIGAAVPDPCPAALAAVRGR